MQEVLRAAARSLLAFVDDPARLRRAGGSVGEGDGFRTVPPKPLAFVPGSWTFVLLPDIQNYSTSYPGLTAMQAAWIVQKKQKNNIQFVMQLGDVTNFNMPWEWQRARDGLSILDGKVPYAIAEGNHDRYLVKRADPDGVYTAPPYSGTGLNQYFPVSRFKDRPTFGGVMKDGHMENSYHLFRWRQRLACPVLGVVLRDEVVAWADNRHLRQVPYARPFWRRTPICIATTTATTISPRRSGRKTGILIRTPLQSR